MRKIKKEKEKQRNKDNDTEKLENINRKTQLDRLERVFQDYHHKSPKEGKFFE